MGNTRPPGVTLFGNAFFDDSTESSTAGGAGSQVFMGGFMGGDDGDSLNDGGRDFGIHFDGEGDFAEIIGEEAGYAIDGSFSISLWATRPDCNTDGSVEWLYSHTKYPSDPRRPDPALIQPGIALAYVCTENGEHSTAAAPERGKLHLVRVYLNDDQGTTVTFDIPLNSAAQNGGYVTREWVHIAVGVGTPTGCTKNSCTDNNEDCCASDNPCGGTVCDDQGDGPCGCDPCAECGDPDNSTRASVRAADVLGWPRAAAIRRRHVLRTVRRRAAERRVRVLRRRGRHGLGLRFHRWEARRQRPPRRAAAA